MAGSMDERPRARVAKYLVDLCQPGDPEARRCELTRVDTRVQRAWSQRFIDLSDPGNPEARLCSCNCFRLSTSTPRIFEVKY